MSPYYRWQGNMWLWGVLTLVLPECIDTGTKLISLLFFLLFAVLMC